MSFSRMLGNLASRLTEPLDDLDAEDLAVRVRSTGCTRMADVSRGDKVTLIGRVRTVSSGGGDENLGVVAEVFDGTGAVDVCWLGRRSVPGIDTGRFLEITGRIGLRDGRKVMFNPRYELLVGQPRRMAEEKNGRA